MKAKKQVISLFKIVVRKYVLKLHNKRQKNWQVKKTLKHIRHYKYFVNFRIRVKQSH